MRDRGRALVQRGLIITTIGFTGLAAIYVRALWFTPIERFQGPAQKIYYLHAPAGWSALLGFVVSGVLGFVYLWLKDRRVDLMSAASAEVGVAFASIVLTTGPIWGKPIWGTWWTWDARLTSTLFITLLYVGYLAMRDAVTDRSLRGRFSAVIGFLGILLVGFVHLSVQLFRTLHPQPIVLKPSAPSLPPEMLTTLLSSFGIFTVLFIGLVTVRYGLALLQEAAEEEAAGGLS